jgi:hypothetical protein
MPRLGDEPVASGSGGLSVGVRGVRRSGSGHSHGKGKKRVSDEGMHEEEGLLSGLRARGMGADDEEAVNSVSCRSVGVVDALTFSLTQQSRHLLLLSILRRGINLVQYLCNRPVRLPDQLEIKLTGSP